MRHVVLAAILAAVLAWAAPVPAFAQQAAQPAPADEDISEEHLRAAGRVIELANGDANFDDILPEVAIRTQNVFTRTNPALTREIEQAVQEAAIEMVPKRLDLARTVELIWARRYTMDELAALEEFFSSDIGRKYTENFAIISALSLGASKQWEQLLSAEMVEVTREKLRAQGHTL